MKTTLHALLVLGLLICTAPLAAAQSLPNATFETWLLRRGSERPASWSTTDDWLHLQGTTGLYSGTVTKTTDRVSGSFAVKLQTQYVFDTWLPALLSLGQLPNAARTKLGGAPFTGRPTHLQFYYKQTGYQVAHDSAHALVRLTRWANGRRQVVAEVDSLLLAAPTAYTLLRLPLRYYSTQAPDSAFVLFETATARAYATGNALYLDDLAFTYDDVTATRNAALAAALQVYPNPSTSGLFTVHADAHSGSLAHTSLTVTDAQGRTVLHQVATSSPPPRQLDLQQQPAGCYLLRLDTPRGMVVRRLVKL